MTEEEWLRCNGPQKMLTFLRGAASDRKLRLFIADCWRRRIQNAQNSTMEKMVRRVEEIADGAKPLEGDDHWFQLHENAFAVAVGSVKSCRRPNERNKVVSPREQARLLRDIFGNPFRPIALDPAWLTSDVLALARGIYDERAFDRMPILADALQDAGCDSEDVLNHCRDANQVHVRGCWVVDLVLGKE